MLVARNNEEKRTKIWQIVTIVTSALIIIIAIFFLIKLFTDNPLEGTWVQKDKNLVLAVKGNGTLYVSWGDLYENNNERVKMEYILDKEEKTIGFRTNKDAIKEAVKKSEGQFTEEGLRADLGVLETTYDYSIDGKKLTLTEREYGEQLIFNKK